MTPTDLRAYRKSLAMNCREFGDYLGVTGAAVSLWELGRNPIPRWLVNYVNALKELEALKQARLPLPVEPGKCACGCGGDLEPAKKTRTKRGIKKGEYPAFLSGHNIRVERKK